MSINTLETIAASQPRISVIGNHNWDHYWEFDPFDATGLNFRLESGGTIDDYASVGADGSIEFKPDTLVAVVHDGTKYFYSPQTLTLGSGGKANTTVTTEPPQGKRIISPTIKMIIHGGGGQFVAEAIDAVSTIPLTYTGPSHPGDIRFGQYLNAKGIDHALLPYLANQQANIVISKVFGRGSFGEKTVVADDRMILRGLGPGSTFSEESIGLAYGTVFINSLKDERLGLRAVEEAKSSQSLGVIAMTPSCSRGLRKKSLAEGFIPIFSDEDLKDYTGNAILRPDKRIDYAQVVDALRKIRTEQGSNRTRVYVTLGKEGSICLDERDMVHRAECYFSTWQVTNTGAGDAFAAGVVLMEHMQRYDPSFKEGIPLFLQLGSAMARSKIAEGRVDAAIVNNTLAENHINYREPLPLAEINEGNAQQLLNPDALRNVKGHTTLEKILGRSARTYTGHRGAA